jgi:hypothetical protein
MDRQTLVCWLRFNWLPSLVLKNWFCYFPVIGLNLVTLNKLSNLNFQYFQFPSMLPNFSILFVNVALLRTNIWVRVILTETLGCLVAGLSCQDIQKTWELKLADLRVQLTTTETTIWTEFIPGQVTV